MTPSQSEALRLAREPIDLPPMDCTYADHSFPTWKWKTVNRLHVAFVARLAAIDAALSAPVSADRARLAEQAKLAGEDFAEVSGVARGIQSPTVIAARSSLMSAIDALAAAPAVQAQPVARVLSWTNGSYHRNYRIEWLIDVPEGVSLYAAPPGTQAAETRMPLTEEEALELAASCPGQDIDDLIALVRATEAKLGIPAAPTTGATE